MATESVEKGFGKEVSWPNRGITQEFGWTN
jgi:hypothetical protein